MNNERSFMDFNSVKIEQKKMRDTKELEVKKLKKKVSEAHKVRSVESQKRNKRIANNSIFSLLWLKIQR